MKKSNKKVQIDDQIILYNAGLRYSLEIEKEESGYDREKAIKLAKEKYKPNPLFSCQTYYESIAHRKGI